MEQWLRTIDWWSWYSLFVSLDVSSWRREQLHEVSASFELRDYWDASMALIWSHMFVFTDSEHRKVMILVLSTWTQNSIPCGCPYDKCLFFFSNTISMNSCNTHQWRDLGFKVNFLSNFTQKHFHYNLMMMNCTKVQIFYPCTSLLRNQFEQHFEVSPHTQVCFYPFSLSGAYGPHQPGWRMVS
jgi:hypothetical protein